MIRRRVPLFFATLFVASSMMLFGAPAAHAERYVRIISPATNGTIPLSPGSVGVSGKTLGPSGTVTVEIFAAKLVNGVWVEDGGALSSGSTAVSTGFGPQPWAVTLNSPGEDGDHYVIRATYKDVDGIIVDTSADTIVIGSDGK